MNANSSPGVNPHGYIKDVPYTWSYYSFQNPLLLSLAARLNGFHGPSISESFNYCDLGCGNGVSVNLLASAFPQGNFVGVDFNQEHIENAEGLTQRSKLKNVQFFAKSFGEYAERSDQKFDFIAMHGIYSWVDAEVRDEIKRVIDKTLNPGGLLYLSYNALPGGLGWIPLWKMIQGYTAHLETDSISKAEIGLKQLKFLRDQGASIFREFPMASGYLDRLLKRDPHYVAHEFCNAAYEPQFFLDVARDFENLNLHFVGSAKLSRNNQRYGLSQRYGAHVLEAESALEREARSSFVRNEPFRRDIFVRSRATGSIENSEPRFSDVYAVPGTALHSAGRFVKLGRRELDLSSSQFAGLIDLAMDGNLTLEQMCERCCEDESPRDEVLSAIHDLIAAELVQVTQSPLKSANGETYPVLNLADPVNQNFLNDRLFEDGKIYLSSKLLGGAVRLGFLDGLFVLALDGRTPIEAQQYALKRLLACSSSKLSRFGVRKKRISQQWVAGKFADFKAKQMEQMVGVGVLVA